MKRDGTARWVAILVNLSVVAGIVILVFELRQNQVLMRAQTRHELSMGIVQELGRVAENPQLASLMRRGDLGEELTPDEQHQYTVRSRALFRYWENVHYQYRHGLYDEVEFSSQRDSWARYMGASPGVAAAWCQMRSEFSPLFRAELDGVLTTYRC